MLIIRKPGFTVVLAMSGFAIPDLLAGRFDDLALKAAKALSIFSGGIFMSQNAYALAGLALCLPI